MHLVKTAIHLLSLVDQMDSMDHEPETVGWALDACDIIRNELARRKNNFDTLVMREVTSWLPVAMQEASDE